MMQETEDEEAGREETRAGVVEWGPGRGSDVR